MISIVILISCFTVGFCDESIKFAAVIFRHGDRTPVNPYPTDPWRNESLWPVKFGELTNTGKRQHFALGKWFRQRYSHLLSDEFEPSEIYVRSTDVDRTLMSAQANLAGLYPPTGKSVWDSNLMWQPIPVHTVPEKEDYILAMKKHCSAYNKEFEKLIQSKAYNQRLSKYQSLINYLSAYTGMKVKGYNDINDIYNVLYIETLYNFTLPNWTHSVYPDKLREPSCYSFTLSTATPLLARLKVGPLLKQIMTRVLDTISNEDDKHLKVSMYSGHDITVANMLNSLGVFDGNCPVYTSTVIIELVSANSTHYLRILYRNSTEIVEPYILNIPYCGKLCAVQRFIQLYDNLLTVDWEHECELEKQMQFPPLLVLSFFVGLVLFVTIFMAHKLYFARIARQYGYHFGYSGLHTATVSNIKVVQN